MLPEERAREKIDKQLINAGWDIVSRMKSYSVLAMSNIKSWEAEN